MRFQPKPYQMHAIKFILERKSSGLFLDMGLGKTVIALTAARELLFDSFDINAVLVIAPLRTADDTWPREIEKWDHTEDLIVSKIIGDKKHRIAALNKAAEIYVINRENVVWLVEYLGLDGWFFDMVIVDELSSFKDPKSNRFKALRHVLPKIEYMIGLTGTPAPNGLLDLWSQIYLLDRGKRLGTSITRYRRRFFHAGRRDRTNPHIVYDWKLEDGAQQEIQDLLSDLCVSMDGKDYLDLPPMIPEEHYVRLPPKAREACARLEKELLLPFVDGKGDVVVNTAATLSNKLLQMANGAVYDENHGVREIHAEKIEMLQEIIESANGQPVMVFYNFRHDVDRLKKVFPKARLLKTQDDIKAWNEGKIPIFLLHPASAGHGLNLQDGGHIAVWFGVNWNLELYLQANKRLHRPGQKYPVILHHILAKDTMDEQVMAALVGKGNIQKQMLDAVKARIEVIQAEYAESKKTGKKSS